MNLQTDCEILVSGFDSIRIKFQVKTCVYGNRTLGHTLSKVCRDYGYKSTVAEIAVKEYRRPH